MLLSLCSDSLEQNVRNTLHNILIILSKGSQCPCGLAAKLEVNEKYLFPYLAELLAKELIVILLPREYRSDIQEYKISNQLENALYHARNEHVKSLEMINEEGIDTRTNIWYEYFIECKAEIFTSEFIYYFAITDKGLDYLNNN